MRRVLFPPSPAFPASRQNSPCGPVNSALPRSPPPIPALANIAHRPLWRRRLVVNVEGDSARRSSSLVPRESPSTSPAGFAIPRLVGLSALASPTSISLPASSSSRRCTPPRASSPRPSPPQPSSSSELPAKPFFRPLFPCLARREDSRKRLQARESHDARRPLRAPSHAARPRSSLPRSPRRRRPPAHSRAPRTRHTAPPRTRLALPCSSLRALAHARKASPRP